MKKSFFLIPVVTFALGVVGFTQSAHNIKTQPQIIAQAYQPDDPYQGETRPPPNKSWSTWSN